MCYNFLYTMLNLLHTNHIIKQIHTINAIIDIWLRKWKNIFFSYNWIISIILCIAKLFAIYHFTNDFIDSIYTIKPAIAFFFHNPCMKNIPYIVICSKAHFCKKSFRTFCKLFHSQRRKWNFSHEKNILQSCIYITKNIFFNKWYSKNNNIIISIVLKIKQEITKLLFSNFCHPFAYIYWNKHTLVICMWLKTIHNSCKRVYSIISLWWKLYFNNLLPISEFK